MNCFPFVMSGFLVVTYTIWIFPAVSCLYNCFHLRHLNFDGKTLLSHYTTCLLNQRQVKDNTWIFKLISRKQTANTMAKTNKGENKNNTLDKITWKTKN